MGAPVQQRSSRSAASEATRVSEGRLSRNIFITVAAGHMRVDQLVFCRPLDRSVDVGVLRPRSMGAHLSVAQCHRPLLAAHYRRINGKQVPQIDSPAVFPCDPIPNRQKSWLRKLSHPQSASPRGVPESIWASSQTQRLIRHCKTPSLWRRPVRSTAHACWDRHGTLVRCFLAASPNHRASSRCFGVVSRH